MLTGFIAVLLSALLLGAGGPVTKHIYNCGVPPLFLLKLRLILALLVFYPLLKAWRPEALHIEAQDRRAFILLGLGFGGYIGCAMSSVKLLSVSLAVFLQYLAPAFIVLFLWVAPRLFRGKQRMRCFLDALNDFKTTNAIEEARPTSPLTPAKKASKACLFGHRVKAYQRPSPLTLTGVSIALLGGLLTLLSCGTTHANPLGIFLGLTTALLYAFTTLQIKHLSKRYTPFTTTFYAFLFAGLFWMLLPPWLPELNALLAPPLWTYAYVILCYTLLPYALFFIGTHFLPPAAVTVTASLEPVVASLVAWLALGESMSPIQITGSGLLLLAVAVLQWETKRD